MPRKPKILIICDYYLPGYESGGAVRTLANMVERLGDRFDFRIITRDHDGSAVRESYETVKISDWNDVGNARVYYLSKSQIGPQAIARLIDEVDPDAIYLNSFFSRLTILFLTLLKFDRTRKRPFILAPEGEFSPGALSLKAFKKKAYIAAAKSLLLPGNLIWKAASESERDDITTVFGNRLDIRVAPNMPPAVIYPSFNESEKPFKNGGKASFIFLSRVARKKNLHWLLQQLQNIEGRLAIDIYGTLEDADYWAECERLITALPPNISISAKEAIPHEKVPATMAGYDFFVLPTLGENFGHVFIESFASGVPVIISDRTPWRELAQKGIGWDLPLDNPSDWLRVIQDCVIMDNERYQQMSANARKFAVEWLSSAEIEESNISVIDAALEENARLR